jgi:excisionase family DNA binding protein
MHSYSVKQAAEYLGLSASLIYGLCSQRRLRHERHGLGRGKIIIPEDALEEYRKSVTVQAQGAAAFLPPTARVKLRHLA